ncbi:MAG: GNAT family N-acetyltransferase [Crocinitomix sp.]|nr:GNAT family N-acetyltransferase [Crocinitomix sp.]
MSITIRPATIADLDNILTIYNHAIKHTTAVYCYDPFTPEMMQEWFDEKKVNNFPVYVSTEGDEVTGFVTYGKFRMRPAYQFTMEHSIYVHHEHRRKGVAKVLMPFIIEIAKQNKIHTLIGGIDAENEVSILFHEQFGFNKVAHIKEAGYKFDRWLDLVFMQLVLK